MLERGFGGGEEQEIDFREREKRLKVFIINTVGLTLEDLKGRIQKQASNGDEGYFVVVAENDQIAGSLKRALTNFLENDLKISATKIIDLEIPRPAKIARLAQKLFFPSKSNPYAIDEKMVEEESRLREYVASNDIVFIPESVGDSVNRNLTKLAVQGINEAKTRAG